MIYFFELEHIVGIDSKPPEIFDFDPTPLLFHSRDRGDEPLIDTVESRKKGWARVVLFSSFLKPGKLSIPSLKQIIRYAFKKGLRNKKSHFGIYPFLWDKDWESSLVEKGFKLVGVDAKGLELRMLAHYMNDKEYTNEVINGDIHTANQTAAGLETRDAAKTFIYAFIYGAGNKKIGSIIGGSERDGERVKEKFLRATPSLRSLREQVDAVSKSNRRWLKGLDGRKIIIRHPHAALNSLLQGAGATVMKVALTKLDEYVINKRIKAYPVVNVHDEFQYEVQQERADEFGRLAVQSIRDAGKILKLRCELDGEYKIGNNWSETH